MQKAKNSFRAIHTRRTVLIAEDELPNQMMLGYMLEQEYDILYAGNGQEVMETLRQNPGKISLILLDLMMPVMDGFEVLREMKNDPELANIPVIVATGDDKAELECLTLGAVDFISKPYPELKIIHARVSRIIELFEEREIISETERDPLTGLLTPEYFYRYARQLDREENASDMDAAFVDINHFHMLNERFGNAYGDRVLRQVGERLREALSDGKGFVCRREADRFLIYCRHGVDYKALLEHAGIGLAEGDGANNRIRLRMGVYEHADKNMDVERRFDRAKSAADKVRSSFSKAIGYYDREMHEKELFEEQLLEEFPNAIAEGQFCVFYQPKFDIRPSIPVLVSAEALVRWRHPTLGMISPGIFIPLFEENGLIRTLDNYVWETAARQIRQWKERFGFTVPVSINVSRIDMYDPELIGTFAAILENNGISPSELNMEITETAYTQDSDQIIQTVTRLRQIGYRIEMDDFGTGYSSLNMISKLPIDALKLDMQFIRNAFGEQRDTRMLKVILDIADSLSVPVIAEGVETEEQMLALREMGCCIVQGYYFSKPIPPEEYERFILERREQEKILPELYGAVLREEDESLSGIMGKAGLALSGGFERIYYVDDRDDSYIVFSNRGSMEDLQIEKGGTNFFTDAEAVLNERLLPEDRERIEDCLRKSTLLHRLSEEQELSCTCRLLTGGVPTWYRIKAVRADTRDRHHIVIGVSNVQEEILEEERRETKQRAIETYSSITKALSKDYFVLYYVDTATDSFLEYHPGEPFTVLNPDNQKEDFFACFRERVREEAEPDEAAKFLKTFDKETVLSEIEKNGNFTITYRVLLDGELCYVSMKAIRTAEDRLVIGVNNVNAEMLREQAQERELRVAREMANRDALTGVKSKRAFVEAEADWNARIEREGDVAFAVVVCDVNDLKQVNDTQGHKAGDVHLRQACSLICNTFKHSPVFRIGGDEFAAILGGADFENREELLSQFRKQNGERLKNGETAVACGMGEKTPGERITFETVFERADADMYENKRGMKQSMEPDHQAGKEN